MPDPDALLLLRGAQADVLNVMREYEGALQRLYAYAAADGWALEALPAFTDGAVAAAPLRIYGWVRLATEYYIFPNLLSNDLESEYELVGTFLRAAAGDRAGVPHECAFDDTLPESAARQRECVICGQQEWRLSKQELNKVAVKFAEWDKDGSGTLDRAEIGDFLKALGKDYGAMQLEVRCVVVAADVAAASPPMLQLYNPLRVLLQQLHLIFCVLYGCLWVRNISASRWRPLAASDRLAGRRPLWKRFVR